MSVGPIGKNLNQAGLKRAFVFGPLTCISPQAERQRACEGERGRKQGGLESEICRERVGEDGERE